jgi:asparagine synthase (glutamine-hydrolysing)
MCGIAGYFEMLARRDRAHSDETLRAQISACQYRGPDATAVWSGPGVGLAHARLSIIDLSEAANQPMFSEDEEIVIVFNGEIYNFEEVRAELASLGYGFRTRSDTEVIIQGYRAWGTDVVHRLRGMFAIALYDGARDRLWLVRDRVGKKPLHYAILDRALVFGSEIKAILRWPSARREPNYQALHQYLTYLYVPSPLTAFKGVHKLPPAHMLVVERGGTPMVSRYFELPIPHQLKRRPEAELRYELLHHLREATRLRMVSDVPVGAFLSGGVDSSSVVAMMALESGHPVKTFTIGLEEQLFDERPFARAVAERYATDHHEFIVRPNAVQVLQELSYHFDEPFGDSSALPTYYVARVARQHVKVVLNGDGGDESFIGYTRYLNCRKLDRLYALPDGILSLLDLVAQSLPAKADGIRLLRNARYALAARHHSPSRRFEHFVAFFSDQEKRLAYGEGMSAQLESSALNLLEPYFDVASSMTQGAVWADLHTYLPDDLLVKVDIATMANSLEARSPFLDHVFMAWAATVPHEQRLSGGEPKALLKKTMEPYLPREVLYRPKRGFSIPVDLWLRAELKQFAYDTLLGQRARERALFDPRYVQLMLDSHMSGQDFSARIWALLMLELWFQRWIDGTDVSAPPATLIREPVFV